MKHRLLCSLLLSSSVGRIFKRRGGGSGNLRVMWTKRKISPLVITPFISPNYRRRPKRKKWSSLKFSLFFCPKLGKDQKKGLYPHSVRLCAQTFCPSYKGGGACRNFAYCSMLIILPWRPKGRAMTQCPPPKYTPAVEVVLCFIFML